MMRKGMEQREQEFLEIFPKVNEICIGTNKAGVVGTIEEEFKFSHQVRGYKFFKSRIRVKRLSEQVDYIPIILPKYMLSPKLYKGKVKILGEFRSFNKKDEEGKTFLELFLWGKRVEYKPDEEDVNAVYLDGYICKKPEYGVIEWQKREIANFMIAINISQNRSVYIPCIAWGENAMNSSMLHVGDRIKLWGRVQSRDYLKKVSGDPEEYQLREVYEVSIFEYF